MRILAVEDQPEYLEMLREVIKAIGHTIVIAKDGLQGLEILENEKIDVIISDVAMPVMGGIEFHTAVRAKKDYANVPFIFLTGVTKLQAVKDACVSDSDMLLEKPFPIDSLIQMFTGKMK